MACSHFIQIRNSMNFVRNNNKKLFVQMIDEIIQWDLFKAWLHWKTLLQKHIVNLNYLLQSCILINLASHQNSTRVNLSSAWRNAGVTWREINIFEYYWAQNVSNHSFLSNSFSIFQDFSVFNHLFSCDLI